MKPQEINEAICKIRGWTSQTRTVEFDAGYQWTEVQTFWYDAAGKQSKVPDYCNDLNAMREVELELPLERRRSYLKHIGGGKQEPDIEDEWDLATASPATRALAYIKAFKDEPEPIGDYYK